MEGDLAKAEPALIDARESVRSIKRNHLTELTSLARPPNVIRLTMEAVISMLEGKRVTEWRDIRKIASRGDFIKAVIQFDTDK